MTDTQEPEVFAVLRKIRYDATAIQAKVTEALTMLADLHIPASEAGDWKCACGRSFLTERSLALHKQNVHEGPPVPLSDLETAG